MSRIKTKFIETNAVTYAKVQQASTATLLGNPTGSAADVSEITLAGGLAFVGTTLTASGVSVNAINELTGDVTAGPATGSQSVAATIANNAVTFAKMQTIPTVTLVANPTGGTAVPSAVTLAGGLAFSGTTLTAAGVNAINQITGDVTAGPASGSQSVASTIASNAVTYAKMQQASTVTLLGNPTGGAANVSEVTLAGGLAFSGTTLTAAGVNAINQLTGDITAGPASGSQSIASTVAKIQGTTVSGTTGTTNVVFSASPTLSGTAIIPTITSTAATVLALTGGVANSGTAGGAITVTGAAGSAAGAGGNGGNVNLNGGTAGGTGVNKSGGSVNLNGGTSVGSSSGGQINITTGNGGAVAGGAGASGGLMSISGGNGGAGTTSSGAGGQISIFAGTGGSGGTGGAGGALVLSAGGGGSGAGGGSLTLGAGNPGSLGAGGSVSISGKNSNGDAVGGSVTTTAGNGGVGTGATGAIGGALNFTAGAGGSNATTSGAGGDITLSAGLGGAGGTPGSGGALSFRTATTTAITERMRIAAGGDVTISTGNVIVNTVGKGLQIKSGANSRIGLVALGAGTATILNTTITANTLIFLSRQATGGTIGNLYIASTSVGTNFVITSDNVLDTSTVAWMLVEAI